MSEPHTKLSRAERRALRRLPVVPEPPLPAGPYMDDDGKLLDAGRALIAQAVLAGDVQDTVAAHLGIAPMDFSKK